MYRIPIYYNPNQVFLFAGGGWLWEGKRIFGNFNLSMFFLRNLMRGRTKLFFKVRRFELFVRRLCRPVVSLPNPFGCIRSFGSLYGKQLLLFLKRSNLRPKPAIMDNSWNFFLSSSRNNISDGVNFS